MIEEDLYSRASKRLSVLRTHLNNSLIEETWLLKNYAHERKKIHEKFVEFWNTRLILFFIAMRVMAILTL